jgi:hypothetical protein
VNFFRQAPKVTPEPTVEELRRKREKELRVNLDRVNAELEMVSARIGEFLWEHKGPSGYRASSLEELAKLPDIESGLRNQEFLLNQVRAGILKELADLTVNERESRHIEGRLVVSHANR